MTIHEAMAKASEGGYATQRVEDLALPMQAAYVLETTCWEAVVRARGVESDCEYIHLERGEPRKLRQSMWLYYWHRLTSHLVAGNTLEPFFATLSTASAVASAIHVSMPVQPPATHPH